MRMPTNVKPLFQGAALGAIACAAIGFIWAGWATGGTARKDAVTAAHDATVKALAPICAESFRAQGDTSARMAELTKASVWERTHVMEKSGFASLPGSKTGEPDLARACVELLMAPVAPKT